MKRIRARQLSDGTWLSRREGSNRGGAGRTYEEADLRRCYSYWLGEAINRGEDLRHAGEEIECLKRKVENLKIENMVLLVAGSILGTVLVAVLTL